MLQNELVDTIDEHRGRVERAAGARLVLQHMAEQERQLQVMAALAGNLDHMGGTGDPGTYMLVPEATE